MKRVDKSARVSYELLYDLGIDKKEVFFSNRNSKIYNINFMDKKKTL